LTRLITNGRIAVALAAIALISVAGGGAFADSSKGGQIAVCVHHVGGGLYQAKRCAKHDTSLTWNRAGIQGPQGPGGKLIAATASIGARTTGKIDGTWTYSLACSASSPLDTVDFTLTGPGVVALIGVDHSGVDATNAETAIGVGFERSFQGGPLVYTLVLQNGTKAVQAQLFVAGTSPCSVFGSAIPLSTS
jgi:hypothetical protein